MTSLPLPVVLAAVAPFVLWATVLVLSIASLCCMIATQRTPRRVLVYLSAALLGAAIILVVLPGTHAPVVFRVLIGIVALALSVIGGGPVSQVVLALATRGSTVPGPHGGIVVRDRMQGEDATREVLRGGTTIGYLERFATTGAIMAGFPEAIAVLIAIKGVGRFSELDAGEAKERFIIGTLTSLIWACICAGLFRLSAG